MLSAKPEQGRAGQGWAGGRLLISGAYYSLPHPGRAAAAAREHLCGDPSQPGITHTEHSEAAAAANLQQEKNMTVFRLFCDTGGGTGEGLVPQMA